MSVETLAIGGTLLAAKSVADYFGANKVASAQKQSAAQALQSSYDAANLALNAEKSSANTLETGAQQYSSYLEEAGRLLKGQQKQTSDMFAQERGVGSEALGRLRDVLLGGDVSQLQIDPGYQFRLDQGNKAIERAARAAGSFGGGGNLSDFARFSQGLASDEYQKSISRLMGLQEIGANANRSTAAFDSQYAAQRAGLLGQLGANQQGLAQNLANLHSNTALNAGNFLIGGTAQANQFNTQAAASSAAGLSSLGNNALNAGLLYFLLGGGGGGAPGVYSL